jgi:4-amino-4-deoxy-L-arabinose transferase-like glycosyltransferase
MSGPAVVDLVDAAAPPSAAPTASPPGPPAAALPPPRPRQRLPRPTYGWSVAGAVLIGLALRAAIGLTDDAPTTDEVTYIASGTSLAEGGGFTRGGHPELHFPPLVPWLLGTGGRALGDAHTAAVVITCLVGAAVVIPVAVLARRLAGDVGGVVAAWTAALSPGLATLPATRGAGSEAEYTLLVVSAVAVAVPCVEARARRMLAGLGGAGLLVGLAYLTRPEGLAVALPIGAVAFVAGWRAGRVIGVARAALAFGAPLLLCVAPYVGYLHAHTGAWQLTAKSQDASIEAWHAVASGDREARDRELYALDETGLRFEDERASLTTLARRDPAGYGRILAANVSALGRDLSGWWLLPLPLWALAAWAAFRRRADRKVAVVGAVAALPVLTALAFFVQPRYLVVTAALATVLVGAAVAGLAPRRRRPVVAGVLVLALAASLATFVGPAGWWHPTDHTDQQAAGEWIARRTAPGDRLMTRSFVVEHFADRTAVAMPYTDLAGIVAYARHYGVRYLAVDETSARRVRPQLLPLLGDEPVPGLRLVHEASAEGRTTRVFALVPAPPRSTEAAPTLGFIGDGG